MLNPDPTTTSQREDGINHHLDRLETERGDDPVLSALRLASSALAYTADTRTLASAQTTARGALLGILKDLDRTDD